MIKENLEAIQARISAAATQAGRDPKSVQLIAVSKTKPMELIHEAYAAGQVDFGENRVQELREKHPELPDAHWHAIGALQRNKVKYIAPFVHLIHSVDNEKLLAEINKQAAKHDRIIDCLLQINISDEPQKGGLSESEAHTLASESLSNYPHVRILGIMGMAEFTSDQAVIRAQFKRLKATAATLAPLETEQLQMKELSMGMSGDFEVAIQEGATLVRIGSAVFGSRY